jgi:hypothetical protein
VTPETLKRLYRAHVRTPRQENPPPGTPQDGEYGLGWGIVKFDWSDEPLLTHNGSNSMNLAKILIDTDKDLGIVVMTNFPGDRADLATAAVIEHLYREFGRKRSDRRWKVDAGLRSDDRIQRPRRLRAKASPSRSPNSKARRMPAGFSMSNWPTGTGSEG